MKTGQTVTGLGLYTTACCSEELIFDTGDVFLSCPQCNYWCLWELEEEIISQSELERLDGIAA